MFSFFVKEEHLTAEEIEEILNQIREEENKFTCLYAEVCSCPDASLSALYLDA